MTIQLIRNERTADGHHVIEAATEKRHVTISMMRSFTVIYLDCPMSRAYRGGGKTYHGKDALALAAANYKCPHMKAIMQMAIEIVAEGCEAPATA